MRSAGVAGLLCAGLALAGCEDRETARARNERRLPFGCKIIDMDYGDLTAAVICDGRKVQTSARAWDETVMIYDPNLKTMMPHTTRYRQITAQIEVRS